MDPGSSTDGRRLIAAVISAPANIARLEEIRHDSLRLADPRALDEPASLALIADQPVVVGIGMSIHASEIGVT